MMEEVVQLQEEAAVEDIEEEDTGMFVCIFILHHLMSYFSWLPDYRCHNTEYWLPDRRCYKRKCWLPD